METILQTTLAVAWLGVAAISLWCVVQGTRRILKDDGPLPLFAFLDRRGLTLRQFEEAVGVSELALAARRCALCSSRSACSGYPVWCPNEPLLRRAKAAGTAA